MTMPPLPPFSSLLKSRDVEDPINIYVHRPLAYAFVAAIYRTPMTPNMVTFLSICVGFVSGAMFLKGTPTAMVVAGICLWTSAILDGADGFLARAKNLSSPFGRALDGSADMIVAIVTVIPAVIHLWLKHHDPLLIGLSVPSRSPPCTSRPTTTSRRASCDARAWDRAARAKTSTKPTSANKRRRSADASSASSTSASSCPTSRPRRNTSRASIRRRSAKASA
ncbi:MAG: CDP-alcohol phosphatidyltransferase family protein [Deltaproteobacteria bacterium]|nr:CDP-alcohol phosphatidyltransferase family protein [Deltaproteobacteria bacterium]